MRRGASRGPKDPPHPSNTRGDTTSTLTGFSDKNTCCRLINISFFGHIFVHKLVYSGRFGARKVRKISFSATKVVKMLIKMLIFLCIRRE